MSTSTERPPESKHTPQETPAAIAREIAQLATAPVRDFVSCISDEDNERDGLYQRLVARMTAAESGAWGASGSPRNTTDPRRTSSCSRTQFSFLSAW